MKILDATAGSKMMWYEKNHPLVTYLDSRKGKISYQYPNSPKKVTIKINPDVVADWTKTIPFDDGEFDVVLFDPPHIIQSSNKGIMAMKFTVLSPDDWKQTLKKGIDELFRVLKPNGMFILKWCESCKSVDEVIKLFSYPAVFGTNQRSKRKNSGDICWVCFLKYNVNGRLNI